MYSKIVWNVLWGVCTWQEKGACLYRARVWRECSVHSRCITSQRQVCASHLALAHSKIHTYAHGLTRYAEQLSCRTLQPYTPMAWDSLRNIIKVGSGYRLIDLEHATAHNPEKCLWSLDFLNPGEYDYFDKAQRMRCLELRIIAEDMMFW